MSKFLDIKIHIMYQSKHALETLAFKIKSKAWYGRSSNTSDSFKHFKYLHNKQNDYNS